MNTKHVIATALLALGGAAAAFAQSAQVEPKQVGASPGAVTRASVRAEARSAMASGELATPSEVAVGKGAASSTTSREAARAEARVRREAMRTEANARARVEIFRDRDRIGAGY
jgi:hypothetical protein